MISNKKDINVSSVSSATSAAPKYRKKQKPFNGKDFLSGTFIHIFLVFMCLFVLLPIVYIVSLSFNAGGSIHMDSLLPKNPTLDNYRALITGTNFVRWYTNTIKAGVLTSIITVVLVAPTSYAFSRLQFNGRKQILLGFLVLQMFPGMMAMVAYYVFLNMLGLLDTTVGLVFLYSGASVIGNTWLMKSFFDTVPKALEEAAMIDGANRFTVFLKILLPLSKPMLVLIAVFSFAAPFGDFVLSKIVLTTPETYTLALGTHSLVSKEFGSNFTQFAASSVLASVPITIVYMTFQKLMVGGLKGAVVQ